MKTRSFGLLSCLIFISSVSSADWKSTESIIKKFPVDAQNRVFHLLSSASTNAEQEKLKFEIEHSLEKFLTEIRNPDGRRSITEIYIKFYESLGLFPSDQNYVKERFIHSKYNVQNTGCVRTLREMSP